MIDDIEELLLTQQWLLVGQTSTAVDRYLTSYEEFCEKSVGDTSRNLVMAPHLLKRLSAGTS